MTITVSFEGYEKEDGTNRTMLMFEELNTGRRYAVPMACKNFRFPRDIPEYTILRLEGCFYWSKARQRWAFFVENYEAAAWPNENYAAYFVLFLRIKGVGPATARAIVSVTGPDIRNYLLSHPNMDDLANKVNAIVKVKPVAISGEQLNELRRRVVDIWTEDE